MANVNRRQFIGGAAALIAAGVMGAGLAGCGASGSSSSSGSSSASKLDKVVFVWEPNESTTTYDGMREEVAKCFEAGSGIPCEMMTTTDYNVTIESLVSGKAQFASLGASEYLESHAKNKDIDIAFVLSNDQGELDEVSYHSMICVRTEDADKYKDANGNYSLDNIKGKSFSFVNLNSTSGFVVPATVIKNQFSLGSTDDLAEGGADKFFSNVLLPGSHPGSLYNLVSGDADLAVFADYLTDPFDELVSGTAGETGAVYKIKEGVDTPLDKSGGKSFTVIDSLAVPAVPICVNKAAIDDETREKIIAYMTGDEVAANKKIFPDPNDTETVSNWSKKTDKVRFVRADDSYYDSFRKMIGWTEG